MSNKYVVNIEERWCKGCGLCIFVCNHEVLQLNKSKKSTVLCAEKCVGCRQCENICPDLAIEIRVQKND